MKKMVFVACVIIPFCLQGQTWQRVLEAWVDNVFLAGAYSGGVNYSRPFWVDIDADNDYDLFVGGEHGGMHYYRNDGTDVSPSWKFVDEFYSNIDVENRSSQAFVDIDNDSDYDLFIGEQEGNINFYRNVGTPSNDSFVLVTQSYEGIDVGMYSAPYFCDIDDDNDYDLFIGNQGGTIYYYRNDGSPNSPIWTFITNNWFGIDVTTRSIPWFADIDADNDFDLFIGCAEGTTYYYRNNGSPTNPNMVFVTSNYIVDVGNTNAPTFVDIDHDGDLDMFIGEYIGNINYYRNVGTPYNASWNFITKNYLTIDMNSSSTPAMVDIDADGDYDLFSGEWVGLIDYLNNSGTATNHRWTIVSENYQGIDVGDNSAPTFVDIDNDNDYDFFIGNLLGNIYYYRNDGSPNSPNFTYITNNYNGIDVGDRGAPAFVDIDDDNDYDLFVGNDSGTIWYYRNDGTPSVPFWTYITNHYSNIDVGERSIPTFTDIDGDNDYDLFIGEYFGTIYYYRNDGTPTTPSFTFITNAFAGINVEENTAPAFADIDADGDFDLFIGERWGGLNHYKQNIVDLIPPVAPYIYGKKIGSNAYFWWRPVTTDTAGNPENINYYVIYRNTSPDFVPSISDSINHVHYPDTTFSDVGAVNSSQSYYYLVKAVDFGFNKSDRSNMGFKFNKFLNENATTTDMNWVSLPYLNIYATISNLTDEMSPNGTSIIQLTNLRSDQFAEDWFYVDGIGWLGTDFAVDKGKGYEFVVSKDTTTVFVGAHDPVFKVPLIENPTTTDMNWVSVPYNAVYAAVSDITDEYSPSGTPLLQVTNLRSDQFAEDWFYIDGIGWLGTDFPIVRGCAYEYVVNMDTTWKPTVYTNRLGLIFAKKSNNEYKLKKNLYRRPVWSIIDSGRKDISPLREAALSVPMLREKSSASVRRPHLVVTIIDFDGAVDKDIPANLTFTAYCVAHPERALFEGSVGCGGVVKNSKAVIWAQFANLPQAWQSDEEAVIIVETKDKGKRLFGIKRFRLDGTKNPQYIGGIDLRPIPDVAEANLSKKSRIDWLALEDDALIGYSIYEGDNRLNTEIIKENSFSINRQGNYEVRPVFLCGYETVLSSSNIMADMAAGIIPQQFSFAPAKPNPFTKSTILRYALPISVKVSLVVFDAIGRKVRNLVSEEQGPGYYTITWDGLDSYGHRVPAGIYFVRFTAEEKKIREKILLIK